MKRLLTLTFLTLTLTGCGQLETILYTPPQTPTSWLRFQPYVAIPFGQSTLIIVQPSTSFIVYLLGIITLGAGWHFWRRRDTHWARRWWSIALILWGIGALLAGTSYEAFSYQIKCAGREACVWTSGWEIAYLIVSVASVDAMLIAQAYSGAQDKWRKWLIGYALVNVSAYTITIVIGTLIPIQFLISFELLLVVTAPTILIFIIQNSVRYARYKQLQDLVLLGAWGWLAVTIAAYFGYLLTGWTQSLWAQGWWFSENDVLHIGLIVWMIYLARVVAPHVVDLPNTSTR